MSESLLTAATRYAAKGWAVFRVKPRNKKPMAPECPRGGWEFCKCACGELGHGCHDATADVDTVRGWWTEEPKANIGLHCGAASGVFVFDVDTKIPDRRKGETRDLITGMDAVRDLEVANGPLPDTAEARTGRGGRHLFYRLPEGRTVKNRGTLVLPDGRRASLDVRSDGGFVVLAPSVHENGTHYRWIRECEPVEAPAWLLDLIAPAAPERPVWNRPAPVAENDPKRKYAAKVLDSACSSIASMGEGSARHDELNKRAFTLGGYVASGYIGRGEVERALYDAAVVAMGEGRRKEIERTIRQGIDSGMDAPITIEDRPGYGGAVDVPEPPAWLNDDEIPPIDDDFGPREEVPYVVPPAPDLGDHDEPRAPSNVHQLRPAPPVDGTSALKPHPDDRTLPKINITQRQMARTVDEAWAAVLAANERDPKLFLTGGRLSRLRRYEQGAVIELCAPIDMMAVLIRVARWMKSRAAKPGEATGAGGFVEVDLEAPPDKVAELMVAKPHPELPVLEQVVYGPTFEADGRLNGDPGYHPTSHRWYEEMRKVEGVPMSPGEARAILYDWLYDFPFASDADRAHALGLFLLPFVRDMAGDLTPMHLIEAPSVGVGKTKLGRVLLTAALGFIPAMQPLPEREEERMKTIASELLAGSAVIAFDNAKGKVDSGSLEAAVTMPRFSARILGGFSSMNVRIRAVWLLTANNVEMSPDMVRRSVRIRLVRLTDAPFDPESARHPDIENWTLENHSRLVTAALVLVAHWLQQGRPKARQTLGSYEEWARVIGGILECAGIPGFLTGREAFRASADPIGEEWREFVQIWADKHGDKLVAPKDLLALADEHDLLRTLTAKATTEGRAMVFGTHLAKKIDNVIAGHQINRRKSGFVGYWLRKVATGVSA